MMRTIDMANKLRELWPDTYTSFGIQVNHHPNSEPIITMTIYQPETSHIHCESLEDGIAKLQARLAEMGRVPSEQPAEFSCDVEF